MNMPKNKDDTHVLKVFIFEIPDTTLKWYPLCLLNE